MRLHDDRWPVLPIRRRRLLDDHIASAVEHRTEPMTLCKLTHKGHHAILALRRARHGIEVGEAVPERVGFERADVGHKVDSIGNRIRLRQMALASRTFGFVCQTKLRPHTRPIHPLRRDHDLARHIGHTVLVLGELRDDQIHRGSGEMIAFDKCPRSPSSSASSHAPRSRCPAARAGRDASASRECACRR
jgi:hypothetical protein